MRRIKKMKWWMFILFPLFGAAFIGLSGFVVMHLWNWLMPVIFGLTTITFWQAVGLFILSKILLSGFHGKGGKKPNFCGGNRRKRFLKERFKKCFEEDAFNDVEEHLKKQHDERMKMWAERLKQFEQEREDQYKRTKEGRNDNE